jgi:hypothetical protein
MRQPEQSRAESLSETQGVYSVWMDQPVILRVAAGEMRVPLRGKLVGETPEALQLRIAGCLDLHIIKSAVLAVEEDIPVPVAVQGGGSRPSAPRIEN